MDLGDAYVEVQQRLIASVTDRNEPETAVPACPGWTVRNAIAHLAGGVVDMTTGDVPELAGGLNLLEQWRDSSVARARDAMTARQVAERESRSLDEIIDEWRSATVEFVPMLRGETAFPASLPPLVGGVAVNDLVVHEGDIRSALGLGPASESVALSLALRGYAMSLDYRVRALALPALVLAYGDKELILGDEPRGAVVRASRHELVRMMGGRRTPEQIRALDWHGDATPYLEIIPTYGAVTAFVGD